MDALDKVLIFRRCLLTRSDCLNYLPTLNVLITLRSLNSSNAVGIYIRLKQLKRMLNVLRINKYLLVLTAAGYVRRSLGKGSIYYITELGAQALRELNNDLVRSSYTRLPSSKLGVKRLKKPKHLL